MFSCTDRSCLKSTKGYQAYTKQKAHVPFKPLMAHETSVALVPPDSAWPPIQDARMLVQDKGLWRWPPHANLLYPFVAPAEFEVTSSLDNRNIDAHGHLSSHLSLSSASSSSFSSSCVCHSQRPWCSQVPQRQSSPLTCCCATFVCSSTRNQPRYGCIRSHRAPRRSRNCKRRCRTRCLSATHSAQAMGLSRPT